MKKSIIFPGQGSQAVGMGKEVFDSNTIKEGHGNTGWCMDQVELYNKVMNWN